MKIFGIPVATPLDPEAVKTENTTVIVQEIIKEEHLQTIVQEIAKPENNTAIVEQVKKEVLENLVVTLDLDTETASHSSTEILAHLASGGSVVAKLNGDMEEYCHLWAAMDGEVGFSYILVDSTGTTQYLYTVRADKSIAVMELEMKPGSGGTVTDKQVSDAVESYLTENPVQPGATAEQAAQIQENAAAIAEIQNPVTRWALTEEPQKYTLALDLADGSTETHVIETDENGYIQKLTVNGVEIPGSVTVVGV